MDLIQGSDPWIRSMDQISVDQIHGSSPWIRSMDQIHGPDPWIRWNVTESTNVGQNRLPCLAYDWKLSYIPLGHGNVLRALLLSAIGSHLTRLPQFGQCCACSIRRLETPFRVLFSTRIHIKSIKNDEIHDLDEPGPFQKEQARSADQKNGTQTSGRWNLTCFMSVLRYRVAA